MTTRIKTIQESRNENLKTKTFEEIDSLAKSILADEFAKINKLPSNEVCAYFNQVMIEYHLYRMEISFAFDAAEDYIDASA